MTQDHSLKPVILCGGVGSRLWPLSTHEQPKQFAGLLGGASLLQAAMARGTAQTGAPGALLVGSSAHEAQLTAIARSGDADLLLEPVRRNTAMAVALATCVIGAETPDAILWILPADHHFADENALAEPLRQAEAAARAGRIATFGIAPTRAASEFGWIAVGPAAGHAPWHAIARFVEKPPPAEAERLLAAGGHLWNSGMFVTRCDVLRAEFARLQPALLAAAEAAVAAARRRERTIAVDAAPLLAAPAMPFDVAIMERTDRGVVVPLAADWEDIGSWDAVWRRGVADRNGNVLVGAAEAIDSTDCLVLAQGGAVGIVGLCDVVVVEAGDAVLVAARDKAQQVKDLALAARPAGDRIGAVALRPWGSFRALDRGTGFQVKHLTVAPGGSLSRQWHHHRAEHWVIVAGRARVEVDGSDRILGPGEMAVVPPRAVHRLSNPGEEDLHVIEVQHGSYLGEDDIERV